MGRGRKPLKRTRQDQVVELCLAGKTSQEIADELGMSKQAVKVHVSNARHGRGCDPIPDLQLSKKKTLADTKTSQIISLYKQGLTYSQIALRLDVSSNLCQAVMYRARKGRTPQQNFKMGLLRNVPHSRKSKNSKNIQKSDRRPASDVKTRPLIPYVGKPGYIWT